MKMIYNDNRGFTVWGRTGTFQILGVLTVHVCLGTPEVPLQDLYFTCLL